jgi:hypothetical protein
MGMWLGSGAGLVEGWKESEERKFETEIMYPATHK